MRQLTEVAIQAAQTALGEQGSFLPGSVALELGGEYNLGAATVSGTQGSNMLVVGLRNQAEAKALKAAVLYRDVKLRPAGEPEDVDAIHVVAEDIEGHAFHALQVYRKNAGGDYSYEQVVVEQQSPVIFAGVANKGPRQKKWWQFWR